MGFSNQRVRDLTDPQLNIFLGEKFRDNEPLIRGLNLCMSFCFKGMMGHLLKRRETQNFYNLKF